MPDIDEMFRGVRDALTVQRVFGEPIEVEGVTLVPAAVVRGGGVGGGDEDNNGGGVFGVQARPAGAYVISNRAVRWRPAVDVNRLAMLAFVLALLALRRR
jgi:uncharacterized spore protein YtfJ